MQTTEEIYIFTYKSQKDKICLFITSNSLSYMKKINEIFST